METKTEKVVQLMKKGKTLEAIKIAKDFKLGYTKKEKSVLTRAHEMTWNPSFYEALGYETKVELEKAKNILTKKYLGAP